MSIPHNSSKATALRSLHDTRPLSAEDILALFSRADEFSGQKMGQNSGRQNSGRLIAICFFEPSTRTRMSFQVAAYRLGHQVASMEFTTASSLTKGETYADTVLNLLAMGPDALVIRYGKSPELDSLLPTLQVPVINAGSGILAHPTQALLDAYTIQKTLGTVRGQRVLIVGDIRHSRVARSNFDVLKKLGAEVAVCGPAAYLPTPDEAGPEVQRFTNLDEALSWPTVFMGLRIQMERHDASDLNRTVDDYHQHFGLNRERLKKLSKDAMIMHPGPINHGVEFSAEVIQDPRNRILDQVSNGVLIRAAVLDSIVG